VRVLGEITPNYKFGVMIEDGPLIRTEYKATPKWAWPGHVAQFRNFWTPNNF